MKTGIAGAFALGLIGILAGCGGPVKETLAAGGQEETPPAIASEAPAPGTPDGALAKAAESTEGASAAQPAEGVSDGKPVVEAGQGEPPKPSAVKLHNGDPNADLIGTWKGEIQMPQAAKDDPMAQMAESMAKMLMGRLKLEIKPGNQFVLNMMFPIEGTLARKGSSLTLKPTKMMGMTPDEAKKMAEGQGAQNMNMDSMTATVSKDGKTITVANDQPEQGKMVFTRAPAENRVVIPTVSAEEKPYVGEWKGEMSGTPPSNATDKEKQQAEAMMKVMNSGMELSLRADNTFTMTMMMELSGKWRAKGGTVTLEILELNGMGGNQAKNDPLVLKPSNGGKTLQATKDGQTVTFRKRS